MKKIKLAEDKMLKLKEIQGFSTEVDKHNKLMSENIFSRDSIRNRRNIENK